MIERGGKVRTMHVVGRGKPELQGRIREHVEAGSAIFSDELDSYDGLAPEFKHEVVNHAVEYVRGNVHTNTMENFWSLLKRGLHGTYISVEPFTCSATSTNKRFVLTTEPLRMPSALHP